MKKSIDRVGFDVDSRKKTLLLLFTSFPSIDDGQEMGQTEQSYWTAIIRWTP